MVRAVRADEILRGLARGEFHAVFQPWVDPRTGAVALLEATLRWRHPARGLLAPCDFMCEADQHGLLEQVALALVAQTAADAAPHRHGRLRRHPRGLLQGDFICAPTPRHDLAAALRRWQASFDAINACADHAPPSSPH